MRETESFTWVGGRPGRFMRIARRIVAWLAVAVVAGLLQGLPAIVIDAVRLREQLDRASWQDFRLVLALAASSAALLLLGLAVEAWSIWRLGRWTRLELGPDGITLWRGTTRRRLGWTGLRAVLRSDRRVTLLAPDAQVHLLSGWHSESDPSSEIRNETEALAEHEASVHVRGLRRFEHDPVARALARRGVELQPMSRWRRAFGNPLFALALIPMLAVLALAHSLPKRLVRWEGLEFPRDPVAQGRRDVERWPDSSMAHAFLATSLLDAGQPAEALAAANAGFELGEPRFILGVRSRALEDLGRHREAARDAAGLLPWDRLHDVARVSDLLIRAGDLRGARRWAEKELARKDVPARRDALARVEAAEAARAR